MNNQDNQQNNKEKSKGQKSRFLRFFKIFGIVVISIVAFLFLAFLGLKSLLVYVDETVVDMQDECNLGCYATCYFNYDRGWENYNQFQDYIDSLFFTASKRKKNALINGRNGYIDCLNFLSERLGAKLNLDNKVISDFELEELQKEVEYREKYLKEEIPKHLKE